VYAGLFVIAACTILNLAGIRVVGITSLWLFFLLSFPFAAVVLLTPLKVGAFAEPHAAGRWVKSRLARRSSLVAMWNYMGWDNASTIAQEVEKPQRTYPKAMIFAVVLVAATYVVPFLAVYFTGIPASAFAEDGAWAAIGGMIGGRILGVEWLRFLIVLGGMMSAFGMFKRSRHELFAASARHGWRRNAAKSFRKNQQAHRRALGRHLGLRQRLGSVSWYRF